MKEEDLNKITAVVLSKQLTTLRKCSSCCKEEEIVNDGEDDGLSKLFDGCKSLGTTPIVVTQNIEGFTCVDEPTRIKEI